MRYLIVNADKFQDIAPEVNAYIECGFTPIGSLCFDGTQYLQAMQQVAPNDQQARQTGQQATDAGNTPAPT